MSETTEWFPYGKDNVGVAIVDYNQKRWIPVADIARATGVRRSTLFRVLDKNPDTFKSHENLLQMETVKGSREMRCVDAEGSTLMLLSVSTGHIRDPELKKRVDAYRQWQVTKMMAKPREPKVEVVTPPAKRVSVTVAIREGKQAAREGKLDARESVSRSLKQYGYEYYVDLLPPSYILLPPKQGQHSFAKSQTTLAVPELPLIESISAKNMIAPSPKPEGMLSATDIGERIGKSPAQVNQFLYNHGLIVMDGLHSGEWRITLKGLEYGCEEPYVPKPGMPEVHRVYWYPKILEKFNVEVPNA